MTGFTGSPRVARGAIVGIDLFNPLASVCVFQYNPDSLSRTLQPQQAGEGGDRREATRLSGAPVETIRLEAEIDATDQLERGETRAERLGIHPQLAALEMLVYPKSALVMANTVLLAAGTIEVVPAMAPLVLLIYGAKRVVPVRLTEIAVTEEAHDPALNPLRARVQLGLRVLSYNDLPIEHPGYHLFLVHQMVKEAMAVLGSVGSLADVAGGDVRLL